MNFRANPVFAVMQNIQFRPETAPSSLFLPEVTRRAAPDLATRHAGPDLASGRDRFSFFFLLWAAPPGDKDKNKDKNKDKDKDKDKEERGKKLEERGKRPGAWPHFERHPSEPTANERQ
ncbi:MAG: hypothetical protein LBI02_01550 [Opitutaceae bacterium]|nr:hypothetical protein [Opitutaceae bacterium]